MKYFKIKKEADQRWRKDMSIFIANELYTRAEKEKFNIPPEYYTEIEIPKSKIYWCFGARFEKKECK